MHLFIRITAGSPKAAQISAEKVFPWALQHKRAISSLKEQNIDKECLFKDAFLPVCFLVRSIYLVLGRRLSLPRMFGTLPCYESFCGWLKYSLQ